MATTAYSAASEQPTFGRLVLCDSLLSLGEDADHARLRKTANRLLNPAMSVMGEPPAVRTRPIHERGTAW